MNRNDGTDIDFHPQEVDDLKGELKKAKEQVEATQNEVEWWRVKHYQVRQTTLVLVRSISQLANHQEQYHMRQQVRDLEDEINALKEENIQAGRHSRQAIAERRDNRQVSTLRATCPLAVLTTPPFHDRDETKFLMRYDASCVRCRRQRHACEWLCRRHY